MELFFLFTCLEQGKRQDFHVRVIISNIMLQWKKIRKCKRNVSWSIKPPSINIFTSHMGVSKWIKNMGKKIGCVYREPRDVNLANFVSIIKIGGKHFCLLYLLFYKKRKNIYISWLKFVKLKTCGKLCNTNELNKIDFLIGIPILNLSVNCCTFIFNSKQILSLGHWSWPAHTISRTVDNRLRRLSSQFRQV